MEPYEFSDQETETPHPLFLEAFVKVMIQLGIDYLGISYFREEDIPKQGLHVIRDNTRRHLPFLHGLPRTRPFCIKHELGT